MTEYGMTQETFCRTAGHRRLREFDGCRSVEIRLLKGRRWTRRCRNVAGRDNV